MIKNKRQKLLAFLLTIVFVITSVIPIPIMAATRFSDLDGNPYKVVAEEWIDKGYIKGYPDNTFKPNNSITRAEFMSLVNKAMGLDGIKEISFSDVLEENWFYKDVQKAYNHGYMNGTDNMILPDKYISRQEFAVVLARLGILDTTEDNVILNELIDIEQISTWSRGAISATLRQNLFEGFVKDEFKATENVSRIEVVVVLNKLIESLLVKIDDEEVAQGPITVTKKSSSSSHRRNSNIQVTNIAVTNSASTVFVSGTSQMSAAVAPTNATNKDVTWSVVTLNNGTATIDVNGLLTATGVGTVTVKATNTASGVTGTTVVTIIQKSSEKAITSFGIKTPAAVGVINETEKTIRVVVPRGTNSSELVATFTSSAASTVAIGETSQVSETTVNNFKDPVDYIVTAQDYTTQKYTVTVIVSSANTGIIDWAINKANEVKKDILISVDGKDVLTTRKWVTQEVNDALELAISEALATKSTVENDEEVWAVMRKLGESREIYVRHINIGKKADKSWLIKAIAAATVIFTEEARRVLDASNDKTALNGAWVAYDEEVKEYAQAIEVAEGINNNESVNQNTVYKAIGDLVRATNRLGYAKGLFDTTLDTLDTARTNIETVIANATTLKTDEVAKVGGVDKKEQRDLAGAWEIYNPLVSEYVIALDKAIKDYTPEKKAEQINEIRVELESAMSTLNTAKGIYDQAVETLKSARENLENVIDNASTAQKAAANIIEM